MKKLFEKVLVAINGSEASISALKYALYMKHQCGSEIFAVYVVDTATIRQLSLSRIFIQDESVEYERSLEESGKRYLAFCDEIAAQKHLEVKTVLRKGSVPGEIVKASIEIGVDCIILGGRPGDVAYRDSVIEGNIEIAKNARCPVLLIKPATGEEAFKSIS
jgi:nucleotide-binding universal stress UspA family protein